DLCQGAFSDAYGAFERNVSGKFEKICHEEFSRRLRAAYPAIVANAIVHSVNRIVLLVPLAAIRIFWFRILASLPPSMAESPKPGTTSGSKARRYQRFGFDHRIV